MSYYSRNISRNSPTYRRRGKGRRADARLALVLGLVVGLIAPLTSGCVFSDMRMRVTIPPQNGSVENEALLQFIDDTYHQRYNLAFNNCLDKSLRIMAEAERRGLEAELMGCMVIYRADMVGGAPFPMFHFYSEVEGERIDVAFDPASEKVYCSNTDSYIFFPFSITGLGRIFCRLFGCPKV